MPEAAQKRPLRGPRGPPPRAPSGRGCGSTPSSGWSSWARWLYYTVNTVLGLYDATLQIARYTNLRELTTDATAGLSEASESLERYVRAGEGYDLSRHYAGRTDLKTSLGAINRHPLTEAG